MPETTTAPPEEWAIVEIMGHLRRAGRISEVERFGAKLLRVDVPAGDTFVSEFFSGSAIYRLRYASEEVARAIAEQIGDPRPAMPVVYRPALPPPDDEDDPAFDFNDEDERPF